MKRCINTFLLLILPFILSSQTNLVQNGDFETHVGAIDCNRFPNQGNLHGHRQQDEFEAYWAQTPPWTCPERKSDCIAAVATSDHVCPGGNFGPTYGYMLNREYICAPLASAMVAGKTYYIEFYIRKGDFDGTLINAGIRFSNDRPKQCNYRELNIDGEPHVEIDNTTIISASAWTKYSTLYIPDQNYSWLTMGTFNEDDGFEQSFHIDDIKIVEWVDDCPTLQLLENWNYDNFTGITIKGDDVLYAGYDVGAASANGDVIVPADADISFKAGNEVGLFDGFAAFQDCAFHAYNAPCGSECYPPTPIAGTYTEDCDGSPYQLGGPPAFQTDYTWTSTPASATAYLSATNIADPVFTPPSTGEGNITYTVTATNACGQTGTNSVTVHYDNDPSSTVQLSLANIVLDDQPSFEVDFDSHVKIITIEVLDQSLSTVFYSSTFTEGIDFTCCDFLWGLPLDLSICQNYKIRVTATNYCTNATASQVIDWNRNTSFALTAPLPNVVTPTNSFCMQFTGAAYVSLTVHTPAGNNVYVINNVPVNPPEACLWAGECNQSFCSNPYVVDGTYYYDLTVYDCGMNQVAAISGFTEVLLGYGRYAAQADTTQEFSDRGEISIYPNPAKEKVKIVNVESGSTISLLNCEGQLIKTEIAQSSVEEMDLDGISPGIYFIEIKQNGIVQRRKLVIY